ncbi:MAG: Membrane dipeptidase [uncultured Thermomicrobiales bacterium]|uniref:Membrane dipeptidase n=1 Tax=uncultured Thermomicrobiales bacterium TaxID=1645740 RepID=A0A6J4VQK8_9BACT|nr:MAG: Membrane dipeptidase [uncultured Thermomicrobiales bacterium]
MLIIDGHLDLAMNALGWNRDLTSTVHEIRRQEAGMAQKGRAAGTVALPELREGRIALTLATLFARVQAPGSTFPGYRSRPIAYGHAQGQFAYYRQLEREGEVRMIRDRAALTSHLAQWEEGATAPLGVVVSMEGADPIVEPEQVADWWADGLRIVGLAHYGPSAYAHGTQSTGPLTDRGRALLPLMEQLGLILDLTHLSDESFWEALERFGGPILASHANCRTLVPGDRQLTDEMIRQLIARDATVGVAMDAWMLQPGWVIGETTNEGVGLARVVDHIDHICQLAGNARHAAIGTDLDGGYGREQSPHDLDTIADLQRIPPLLRERGYAEADVEAIMSGNWRRLLERALPAE